MAADSTTRDSPWLLRLAYASGDAGFNFYWVFTDAFLLFFYAEVFRLPLWSLTPITVAGRGLDLLGSIAIGSWADKTRTRFGSYRPFLLSTALPLAAAAVAMFSAPAAWPDGLQTLLCSPSAKIGYAVAASCAFALFYTIANVPYTALLTVITADPGERVRLASTRFAAAAAVVLATQYFTLPLVRRFGAKQIAYGWQTTAVLYSCLATVLLMLCFAGTREIVPATNDAAQPRPKVLELLRLPDFQCLFAAMALSLAALTCRGAVSVFYINVVTGRPEWTSLFLTGNSLTAFCVCLFAAPLAAKALSTLRTACLCAGMGAVVSAISYFVPSHSLSGLLALQIFFGAGTGILLPAIFSLFADLPLRSPTLRGRSVSGLVASGSLVGLKLGATAGASTVSTVLAVLGYRSGTSQTEQVKQGIATLFSFAPCVLFLLALLALRATNRRDHSQSH